MKPGAKYFEWETRGVPFRLELGPRDLASESVMIARRTGGKMPAPMAGLAQRLHEEMNVMQQALLDAAIARRERATIRNATKDDLIAKMTGEGGGGFVYGGWCGGQACEAQIKNETKATIRVLPDAEFRSATPPQRCIWCDAPCVAEAVWAKAY